MKDSLQLVFVIGAIVTIACFTVFGRSRSLPWRMLLAIGYISAVHALIHCADGFEDGAFAAFIACLSFGIAALADAIRSKNKSPTSA